MHSRSAALLRPQVIFPFLQGFRRSTDSVKGLSRLMPLTLVLKRQFDIVVSLFLLVLLSPLFLLLIIGIPLDSPGNPFFIHDRIGLHGRTFRICKFRTMRTGAHAQRNHLLRQKEPERLFFKHKQDPRVTRLGHFLRKYSLDELPQLFNVLLGEMSLVGPRPLLKEDFEGLGMQSSLFLKWVRERHRLWPGITGLWQVSGRNELTFEQSMRLDLQYVTQWSLGLDFTILFRTPEAVLAGRGAY